MTAEQESRALILVAGADPRSRQTVCSLLEGYGYDARGVDHGDGLLEAVSASSPSLIVFDAEGPKDADPQTIQAIQARFPQGCPRILLCAAQEDPTFAAACAQSSTSAFLKKPLQSEILAREVQRLLATRPATPAAPGAIPSTGEFEVDAEFEAEVGAAPGVAPDAAVLLEVPPGLKEGVLGRIAIWRELDRLDAKRKELLQKEAVAKDAVSELQRQTRETKRLLTAAEAQRAQEKLRERLTKRDQKVASGEMQPLDADTKEAYQLAVQQWRLFIEWEKRGEVALREALQLAGDEPLYQAWQELKISGDVIFGWSYHILALETLAASVRVNRDRFKEELGARKNQSSGMLQRLRVSDEEREAWAKLENSIQETNDYLRYLSQEQYALEKTLVDAFWEAYRLSALWFAAGSLSEKTLAPIRAYLRYGMISSKPVFLKPDVAERILQDCSGPVTPWRDAMKDTHILYADEYLWHVARGAITSSIDEDLELNQRNSPAWKADKSMRRIIYTRVRESALREMHRTVSQQGKRMRARQAKLEKERDRLKGLKQTKDPLYRQVSNQFQEARVQAARLERVAQRIEEDYIPKQQEARADAQAKLDDLPNTITRNALVEREVAAVRRVSRLVAKLKEPFLPFLLRDQFKPDIDTVNFREIIAEHVERVEASDPLIFKELLMPVNNRANRLFLRYSPVTLIAPACGFLGYAWNPRAGSETGRLVIPAYCPRSGIIERILHDLFADFRWDTSKADAGVDLLTSDTLVAMYATVRWDYRKRSKETREKAAIFTELSDRVNWRRHYGLYVISADEGGKRLFFKNKEVYYGMLKYIDLPEGVEKLRQ